MDTKESYEEGTFAGYRVAEDDLRNYRPSAEMLADLDERLTAAREQPSTHARRNERAYLLGFLREYRRSMLA